MRATPWEDTERMPPRRGVPGSELCEEVYALAGRDRLAISKGVVNELVFIVPMPLSYRELERELA